MAIDKTTHPYGPGSHAPLADVREMPACYPIKGNVDSMLYHRPDSQNYGATIAEVWFDSPSAAEAAGFGLAPRHSKDGVSADYEPGGSGHPCSAGDVSNARAAVLGLGAVGGMTSDVHPYGAGSHAPLADVREMPACYPIKGNVDSMLYHRPDSQNYGATIAEVWFDSPSAAEAAGFGLAPRHSKDGVSADYEPGGSGHPCTVSTVNANRSAIAGGAGIAAAGLAPLGGAVSDVHPYGAGSHAPLADVREMPACYPIKGNVDSMLYHRPDSQNYGATIAEVWFDSPSAAEAAGFALAPRHSKDGVSADYEPGGSGHPCAIAAVNANRTAVIGGAALATGGMATLDGDSDADSGGGLGAGAAAVGAAGAAAVAGLAGLAGRDDDTVDVTDLVAGNAAADVDLGAGAAVDGDIDGASGGLGAAGAGAAGAAAIGGLAGLDARDGAGDLDAELGAGATIDGDLGGAADGDIDLDDDGGSRLGGAALGGAAAVGGAAAAAAALGGDALDGAGDLAGDAAGAVGGVVGGAGDLAGDAAGAVGGAVSGAGDLAGDAGGAVVGAAGDVRDGVGAGIGKAAAVAGGGAAAGANMLRGDDDDDDGAGLAGCLRKWWWLLLLLLGLLLLALLLSQCGGDDDDAAVAGDGDAAAVVDDVDADVADSSAEFDANGFNADGFDVNGFDVDGFDVNGFDVNGFDVNGFNADGFDVNGFDVDGFDVNGFNADGFDVDGFDVNGFNADGFDVDGFDVNGFNADGFDVNGFDVDGFDVDGLNADGESADGAGGELTNLAAVAQGASPQVAGLLGPLGLTAALEGDGPFTVFLPSDEGALAAIGANPDLLDSLSNDPDAAASVLGYHIVPGVLTPEDIAAGGTFVTSTGLELTIADGAVNGITLSPVALEGTNGVIYVLDGVLLPPASPQLAVTGVSTDLLAGLALAMVLIGGGFVVAGRRNDELVSF